MPGFEPVLSFESQRFFFLVLFAAAFASVVMFFLYENSSSRNILFEFVLAVIASFTLGSAIFFGLIREDIIL
ncbi:hypothetical protein TRFO_38374 [Tritrichomonas foetus]|uniref:Dolichyl-diphosphooligosaccharide-protein glycosyltransferase subunit OST5 n=1 Tax=Tritrichomonas foetus TaxID=1144522 RepID=A0A1J4JA12_9EUKA|nr:hypothetical protein TRFO_38374 [Tritrichomonas foetus]|eukprot:OHS95505.1 hypothetical protein TRFO_38374 [Tritrichomonas foetus]